MRTWEQFIDRIYDYRQAVRRETGNLPRDPEERDAGQRDMDLKLQDVDKMLVKLEFLGEGQAGNLQRAQNLLARIQNRQVQQGEILQFAKSIGASLRRLEEPQP
ncbi:MAG TPA: hypothetical protein VGX68_22145 [Thermoanaerobaculia bacterium]|jgi:hypothetical protein|nr:hypothetical protein [Thermoanaerobaculia bacterium]